MEKNKQKKKKSWSELSRDIFIPLIPPCVCASIVAPVAIMANKNAQEPTSDGWYDLSKLDYTPSKQLYFPEGLYAASVQGIMNVYLDAIFNDINIFKEDLVWSIQRTLKWKMEGGTYVYYKLLQLRKFKVKIDDLSIEKNLDDPTLPGFRFSCKYSYDIDLSYRVWASTAKIHDITLTGSMDFKNIPMYVYPALTSDDWKLVDWDGTTYTPFYSYSFSELKDDDKWSITMNENGIMTQRDSGKISINDFVWNKDTLSSDKVPAVSFFSTILMEMINKTESNAVGKDYGNSYFMLVSYYMDQINRTYIVTESGPEEEKNDEGEASAGEEGAEEAAAAESLSGKVLI